MCGIAGLFGWDKHQLRSDLKLMSDTLIHRGPDDEGIWLSQDSKIGFAHRRLSILDLSESAHQPMNSYSKRYWMVFNGEIYNYRELCDKLDLPKEDGVGDTRILLECFSAWGVDETLRQIRGMYAIGLWDSEDMKLFLARDPIGIKPLYFGRINHGWAFASELKALSSIAKDPTLSNQALDSLFSIGTIPNALSIYEDVKKCLPGYIVTLTHEATDPCCRPIHSILESVRRGVNNKTNLCASKNVETLDHAIRSSVKAHLVSDVEVGCFLSGGIDSSLISAIAQDLQGGRLKTFTIGLNDENYNEAKYAREIATYLGTDHHELYLDPKDILESIPEIIGALDEPFADSSLIPTYFVSKMTRSKVKVVLSGDGGDELFCGYTRYRWSNQIWSVMRLFPRPIRLLLRKIILSVTREQWDRIFNLLGPIVKRIFNEKHVGQKLYSLSRILVVNNPEELYQRLICLTENIQQFLLTEVMENYNLNLTPHWSEVSTLEEKMMLSDLMAYLPNDILTKVDRATMMVGLEARVPLLTPELVQLAWSLPVDQKKDKKILKQVLNRYLPQPLTDRPKMGFGIPIGQWLRGPLAAWADDLLNPTRLKKQGLLKIAPVQQLWQEHLQGRQNHEYLLWNHLVFQQWIEVNKK